MYSLAEVCVRLVFFFVFYIYIIVFAFHSQYFVGDGNRKNDEIILVLSVGIVFCCRLLYTNLIFGWHRGNVLLYDINQIHNQEQFTYL